MLLDYGIFSSLPAAGAGTVIMAGKSKKKREELDILSVEHADVIKQKKLEQYS